MKKNTVIIIVIITMVLSGLIGFLIGKKYQTSRLASMTNSPFGTFGYNRFGNRQNSDSQTTGQPQINNNRMGGSQQVIGEILSQDDKSITVKMTDGSSKIVFVGDTTIISKSSSATKTDLKVGEKVAVFGPENTDGSVTANNIQLNPTFRGMNGGTPRP